MAGSLRPLQPAAHCEKSSSSHTPNASPEDVNIVSPPQAHLYGEIVNGASAPWVELYGQTFTQRDGIWRSAVSGPAVASAYSILTRETGAPAALLSVPLPPLRVPSFGDWIATSQQADQSQLLNWYGSQPGDQFILNLGSSFSFEPFPDPFMTTSGSHSLVCALPPASASFVVSAADWSFALPWQYVTFYLEAAAPSLQKVPGTIVIPWIPTGPAIEPDLALVLIRNGIQDNPAPTVP